MRGWIAWLLVPLVVPAVAASTEVRAFSAEVDGCGALACSTRHEGTFQLECDAGSCVVALHVDARYDGQVAGTTKTLEAYGLMEGGAASPLACRAQATAKAAACNGGVLHPIALAKASCRSYDIVAHANEQLARAEAAPAGLRDVGFQQEVRTGFTLCRSGSGAVSVVG